MMNVIALKPLQPPQTEGRIPPEARIPPHVSLDAAIEAALALRARIEIVTSLVELHVARMPRTAGLHARTWVTVQYRSGR